MRRKRTEQISPKTSKIECLKFRKKSMTSKILVSLKLKKTRPCETKSKNKSLSTRKKKNSTRKQ